jgi:hypothetical protein
MNLTRKQFALIAAACGLVAVLSVFLPWISIDMPAEARAQAAALGMKTSVNGTGEGLNGVLVLILSLVGAGACVLVHQDQTKVLPLQPRQYLFLGVGVFGLALLLLLLDFFDSLDSPVAQISASRGFGMYLCLLALLGAVGASYLATTKPAEGGAAAPATPPPA